MDPSHRERGNTSKDPDMAAFEISVCNFDGCSNAGPGISKISDEIFLSDLCISDIEHLCTDSMREYEDYIEMEKRKDEKDMFTGINSSGSNEERTQVTETSFDCENSKEAFSFIEIPHGESGRSIINDPADDPNITHDSCIAESDSTAKRYKSSTSSISCQDMNKSNSSTSLTLNSDKQASSEFKIVKIQEICIDSSKVESSTVIPESQEKNECSSRFIKDLMSSLSEISQETTSLNEEVVTQVVEEDVFESIDLDGIVCFDNYSFKTDRKMSNTQANAKCTVADNSNNMAHKLTNIVDKMVDSGFTTGNNKNILVNTENIKYVDFYCEESQEITKNKNCAKESSTIGQTQDGFLVESGFMTGKNQTILIDLRNTKHIENQMASVDAHDDYSQNHHSKSEENGNFISMDNAPGSTFSKDQLMRKCSIVQQREVCRNAREDLFLSDIFSKVQNHFKKEEDGWIFEQFKWSWLHLYLNNEISDNESILEKIIEIMTLKHKYERSILRRIVEFDDVPFRFMVLGLIDYSEEHAELFDGFYSLKFKIDENIYRLLKNNGCTLGSKLFIFGSAILLKEATSIFDIQGAPLKLFYNSVKICHGDYKLGVAKKIAFLNTISAIRPDGGVVSALTVRIKQILEIKYLVTIENYKNRVDDLEKEIEKIYEIAGKTGYKVNVEDISVRQYCKLLVEDETGECYLTWWNSPEIRTGERYKFVFLNTIEGTFKLHLTTTKKTYTEKVSIAVS